MTTTLESLRESLPEAARDLKVNLQAALQASSLTEVQRWGVALACAIACRDAELRDAVLEAAREHAPPETVDDARAAAALMAMNNVYYRFKHMIGKEEYQPMPARLRMTRLGRPQGPKLDFELMCLAVSAITGCERCLVAHERTLREAGASAEQVHDAARLAAIVHGVVVGLRLGA